MKAYIVWNEALTEGVIFTGEEGKADAKYYTSSPKPPKLAKSSLGEAFIEIYEGDTFYREEVELPDRV